jgi:DNA-nicking Smr family endonuclease
MDDFFDKPIQIEIDGILDLHHFSPKDLSFLLPDYIDECLQRNILEIKIIHGKGKGVLRRTVHALLERHPAVRSYRLAGETNGSWGATVVLLRDNF